MKTKLILLCALAFCNATIAQNKVDVPANIKADFAKKYPTAIRVIWENEDGKYGSTFYVGKKQMAVEYGVFGTIEETETIISFGELPIKAQKYAKQKGKVYEAGKVEFADGTIFYEAELKGKDLLFDQEGNFVEERSNTGDDEG